MRLFFCHLTIAGLVLLYSGCGSRTLLLKEYRPSCSDMAMSQVAGKRVKVVAECPSFDVRREVVGQSLPAPENVELREWTEEEEDLWDNELEALKKEKAEEECVYIGWRRNMYGMHIGDIHSVNEPGVWLEEMIEMELAEHGAVIVDDGEQADVTLTTAVAYLKVDLCMVYWCDLIVDVEYAADQSDSIARRYHITAKQGSFSGSAYEYYQCVRKTGRRFMHYFLNDLSMVLEGEEPPTRSAESGVMLEEGEGVAQEEIDAEDTGDL